MLKDASYDAVFAAVDFYANLFLVFILGKFNGISLDKAIFQFDAVADLIKLLFCNFLVKEDVIDFLFEEFQARTRLKDFLKFQLKQFRHFLLK